MSPCRHSKSSELCSLSQTTDIQRSRVTISTAWSSRISTSSVTPCEMKTRSIRGSKIRQLTEMQHFLKLSSWKQHSKQKFYGPTERKQKLPSRRQADQQQLTRLATVVENEDTTPKTVASGAPNASFVTDQDILRRCARKRRAKTPREKHRSSMAVSRNDIHMQEERP